MSMRSEKSIALVGRPNVGKSRLFNRLVGRRVSIVYDKPGVTRDIVSERLSDGVLLMDTGGIGTGSPDDAVAEAAEAQAKFAVDSADALIFVVDSREGLTPSDEDIARLLRSSGKPVVMAVNKVDVPGHGLRTPDFYKLGFKHSAEISAEHGTGMENLLGELEYVVGKIKPSAFDGADDRVKISVAGKPNVGKSSIVNRLLGEDRVIVTPVPGTTRDSVKFDIDFPIAGGARAKFRLFDTAGLKAKRKTNSQLDYLSSLRARRVLSVSDVVFLVVDAKDGVGELDKILAEKISENGASVLVVVNKWDRVLDALAGGGVGNYKNPKEFGGAFERAVREKLPSLGNVPVLFVSALGNFGIDKLLEGAWRMYNKANAQIPTGRLNSVVREIIGENPPGYVSGKIFKVYYCVKVAAKPFTLRLYCNTPGALSRPYGRYIVNALRNKLDLGGVAVRLELEGKAKRAAPGRTEGGAH